jgi:hypothetical protein
VVSRIPRSAATIVPYDVESRVRVLQERQAAKVASAPQDAAQQNVRSEGAKAAARPGLPAEPPAEESLAKESAAPARGLVKRPKQGGRNGQRSPEAGQGGDEPSAAPGITPIGSLTTPGRATVEGRIRMVEIKPVERNSVLACEISDGTGELTAMFYGRSHIPGIVCGGRIRFRGTVGIRADGHPVMINPAYELLFPAL